MDKPSANAIEPLASLTVPKGCCKFASMYIIFGCLKDSYGNTGIVVFVNRLSKMVHLTVVPDFIDIEVITTLFL